MSDDFDRGWYQHDLSADMARYSTVKSGEAFLSDRKSSSDGRQSLEFKLPKYHLCISNPLAFSAKTSNFRKLDFLAGADDSSRLPHFIHNRAVLVNCINSLQSSG